MTKELREKRFHKRLGIKTVRYERMRDCAIGNFEFYVESAFFWAVVVLMSLLCLGVAGK